jgi:hypothetical protein
VHGQLRGEVHGSDHLDAVFGDASFPFFEN